MRGCGFVRFPTIAVFLISFGSEIQRYSDPRAGRTYGRRARAPVAQRIEQQPSNLSVVGSSPTGGAKHGSD